MNPSHLYVARTPGGMKIFLKLGGMSFFGADLGMGGDGGGFRRKIVLTEKTKLPPMSHGIMVFQLHTMPFCNVFHGFVLQPKVLDNVFL